MFQLLHVHTAHHPCTRTLFQLCLCTAKHNQDGVGNLGVSPSNMLQLLAVLRELEATYHLDITPRVSRTHNHQPACFHTWIHLLSTHSCSYLTHLTFSHLPVTRAASCFGSAFRPFSLPDNKFHSQHAEGLTQLSLGWASVSYSAN